MTDYLIGRAPEQDGEEGVNEFKSNLNYLVVLDDPDKNEDDACAVAGIPDGFSLHPTVLFARVRHKSATRQATLANGTYLWKVKVEYSTPDNNTGDNQENDDPTLDIAEMSISFDDREEVLYGCKGSGRVYTAGIKNSAGEIFSPPPTKTTASAVLEIKQNYVASYAILTTLLSYMDTINSDTWLGCSPHTAKVVSVSPKSNVRNGSRFLEVTITIKIRPTWDLQLLDIGTYYIDPDDGKRKEFLAEGTGHPRLGLLNGSGAPLGVGAAEQYLPKMQIYTEIPFSGLGLPSDLSGYKFV